MTRADRTERESIKIDMSDGRTEGVARVGNWLAHWRVTQDEDTGTQTVHVDWEDLSMPGHESPASIESSVESPSTKT